MLTFTYGRPTPAMSNTERQRQFRERNPGYYGRLHRERRAGTDAFSAAKKLAAVAPVVVKVQRLLPAPVERIPGVDAIPTREEWQAMREREAECVARSAA